MNYLEIQNELRQAVAESARRNFNIELGQVAAEVPPKAELGDLAFPVAFEVAKQIKLATGEKQNPREIGETIKADIEKFLCVDRVVIAGAGYLNVYFDRTAFLASNAQTESFGVRAAADPGVVKVCVEHTSVNPNKAAHIGHVRNSVLGDTFQRMLKALGKRVEVQNYIDNTGVQVADVVVGFKYLANMDLEGVQKLDSTLEASGSSFDFYCWDLYARVGHEYQSDPSLLEKRSEVLHLLEEGENPTAELADFIATRNVECILKTMERLSIRYDLLPRESEILHLHFWDAAFEKMKALGVIYLESEGKNAGCWVMPLETHAGTEEHDADKILVRSNGTVTYTGKDIAYQMWKLGLLGMDFYYRPFYTNDDGSTVWITTADPARNVAHDQEFGHGETVFNVIDSRQSYTQDVVKKGVSLLAPDRGEEASIHLAYEMVALSPSAAAELGFELSEADRSRSFVEMSGRKGLGVKADDLIDRLERDALAEVESRHPDVPSAERSAIARQIAVGALRYFLLKFTRNTVIIFDFKEALSFEGETGCFCQYSAVRANSIFRKLEVGGESIDASTNAASDKARVAEIFSAEGGNEIWSMLLLALRLDEVVRQAANQHEPAILAKYTFNLAKTFNLFYHHHKILPEADPVRRAVLLLVADAVRRALTSALGLMGIEIPPRM